MKFELTEDALGKNLIMIDKDGVISAVPFDLGNADYQRYLRWAENPDAEEFTGETLS